MNREATLQSQSLEGQFLIAMPSIGDDRFSRSVIYMCAHSDDGAMGLVINQQAENLSYSNLLDKLDLFSQVEIECQKSHIDALPVHIGGPVATSRGFVLHSSDFLIENSTLQIDDAICLTSTVDIIQAIAVGDGPTQSMTAIGYSGWGPGQLEFEIQKNGWLTCPADHEIIFDNEIDHIYDSALTKLGIDIAFLASEHGHA